MVILQVSKGYQITIPANLRKKYNIKIGSKLDLEEKGNQLSLELLEKPDWDKIFADVRKLPKHNYTTEQLDAIFEKELFRRGCNIK
ncbi:AbrB/MazE/SpoVT family DNA-binding domain-containing protein [Candidatus Woesearchaeota archaeon]|nr:AbrB/MazE/SpoVT family DNA-binding domain-containing protein [Candidatus Woesearchaeota archaeon]